MENTHVITKANPVPCARLKQLTFSYRDFAGKLHEDGQIVVLDVAAEQVQAIFKDLLAAGFPIEQARPLEAYQADDEASMATNNTSAFNGRAMTGGSNWSKHAYGAAIDINPVQNPFISNSKGKQNVLPAAGSQYLLRAPVRPGMAEAVLDIFFRHGFMIWGGYWKQPVDYQHFEIGSRAYIAHLLALPLKTAQAELQAYGDTYVQCISQNTAESKAVRQKNCSQEARK